MSFSEWKEYFLGDLVENLSSKRVPLSSRQREGRKGIYPYYGAQGIIDYIDDYIFDGEYLLVAEDGNNLKERKEDIAQIAKGKFWVNNHAHVLINNSYSDIKFIKYYLNQLDITPYITGSAQPKLNKANLSKIKVIAPTKSEQISISNFLGMLDEKIELNNQMNETLEEMAQALFKRWFIDFEFPNEEGHPYKSSGGEMVESELGMIPKGWEVKQIDNLATITRGASPRPIQDYMSEEGIPWVKISDATNSGSKYLIETKEFIKEEGRRKSREVTQGTLILSNSATPGIPKIMLIDACVHDGWLIFRNYKDTTIEFMYYVLLHEQKRILALSNGSVFRNLKTDILKNYKIVVPDKRVLLKFTKIIEEINENIKIKVLENKSLMEIRDNLLPKLMSGEIRVNDLES